MNEPKGFWSAVFYEATKIMKERPNLGAETAFWMAKAMVSGQPEFSFKPKEA